MGCFLVSWFSAHQSRVDDDPVCPELEWVLSTGQDKAVCLALPAEWAALLGGYRTSAVASGLQYPLLDRNPLVGT